MVGPEISRRLPYIKELRISMAHGIMGGIMLGGSFLHNYLLKRPLSSSVPRHIAVTIFGAYAGSELRNYRDKKLTERVLVMEDYISRHPEDFPISTPKKYKDLLLPWTPLR